MRESNTATPVSSPCLFSAQHPNKGLPLFHEDFSTAIVTLRVITITKSDYGTFIIIQDVGTSEGRVRDGCGSQ